jgi:hypothetical protein
MTDLTATDPQPAKGGTKRIALLAGVAVLAVGAVGGGIWGYNAFYGQSEQAASVLPVDGLLGYVGLDLAPNGEQLLAARATLKKFPGIADQIELGGDGDLRKELFTKLQEDGTCTDIDWDKQVAPWLGDRIGIGVMDGGKGKEPEALVVFQTTDEKAAEKNVDTTLECLNDGSPKDSRLESHALIDGWLVLGEGDLAKGLASKVAKSSLADDETFQTWTEAAGDPGIDTLYAAPLAGERIREAIEAGGSQIPKEGVEALSSFTGGGGVARFVDGGLEAEFATAAAMGPKPGNAGGIVGGLPSTTVAALGLSLPDQWADAFLDGVWSGMAEATGMSEQDAIAMAEELSGLALPKDLETLLGDELALAIDSGISMEGVESGEFDGIKVGLKIKGDTAEISKVLDKIKESLGPAGNFLHTRVDGDVVVVTVSDSYANTLANKDGLGASKLYPTVVPESAKAASVFFLDFDAEDWLVTLLGDLDATQEAIDNVEPLRGLGISSWVDGDDAHARLKVTTD